MVKYLDILIPCDPWDVKMLRCCRILLACVQPPLPDFLLEGGRGGGGGNLESFVLQSDCLFEIRYLHLHQHLYSFLSFNAIGTFLHGTKLNINAFWDNKWLKNRWCLRYCCFEFIQSHRCWRCILIFFTYSKQVWACGWDAIKLFSIFFHIWKEKV